MTSWIWTHLPELGGVFIVLSVPVGLLICGGGGKEAPAPTHDARCPECREVA